MKIGGMGGLEIVIILVVILIIFGPKNLPKLGNAIGKTLSNLRAGMSEGKKKEVDGKTEAEAQEPADDVSAAPAQIAQGEAASDAEDVEFADDEAAEADGAVAVATGSTSDDVIGSAEIAVSDAESAVDEAFQQKKVKRVVRKKAVTDEAE